LEVTAVPTVSEPAVGRATGHDVAGGARGGEEALLCWLSPPGAGSVSAADGGASDFNVIPTTIGLLGPIPAEGSNALWAERSLNICLRSALRCG